jgi:hypothetical protein
MHHPGRVATALLFASVAIMPAQQSVDPYPFAVGNYWEYRGRVSFPPEPQEMTWRSAITKVVHRQGGVDATGRSSPSIAAAVFDNFPLGLPAWYPGSEGPLGILIEVKSRKFYAIAYTQAAAGKLGMQRAASEISGILRRVEDPRDNLSDLLDDLTPVIEMPLAPGKGWGVPFSHWSVTQREKISLIGVRGARAPLNREGFILENSDNTGTVKFDFVPGVGITHVFSESLLPRGNPGHRELDVRLVEVHLDQPKAAVAR